MVARFNGAVVTLGWLRLLAGSLILTFIWLELRYGLLPRLWTVPLLALVGLVGYHGTVRHLRERAIRSVGFYQKAFGRLEGRWADTTDHYLPNDPVSHANSHDLDIFGPHSLFDFISIARTDVGRRVLAAWFSAPANPVEILRRQQAVDELRNNIDLREDLAVLGEAMEETIRSDQLQNWCSASTKLNAKSARIVGPILVLVTQASIAGWLLQITSLWLAILAVSVQIGFAIIYRSRVRALTSTSDQAIKHLQSLGVVLARIERIEFKSHKLLDLRRALRTDDDYASTQIVWLALLLERMNSRRNVFFAPIGMLLLWTTQIAFGIESWRRRYGASVDSWLNTVGELEALSSLAGYAYENPCDVFPEIEEGGPWFEAERLRHPLIAHQKAIPNDVFMNRDLQLLVVTGSNMSGKSTLLRTVGVNTVLAMAGAPVRATRMRLSVLSVGTSIKIMDSLQSGTSRFYAELQKIRDIIRLTKLPIPVLFLIDEIFQGTNSHDRLAGAEIIVRHMLGKEAIGIVTTHDLSLTEIVDRDWCKTAANFYFQDDLIDGHLSFDYCLRPGIVQKSNALELMRMIGVIFR